MTKLNGTSKNVVEVMEELKKNNNMQMGIDEVEFPDGTKEKFFYNGEEDRQAAIEFAQICYDATHNTPAAKQMMFTCFMLMTHNIKPSTIVEIDGDKYYVDHNRKLICDARANIIAELSDEEKTIEDKQAITLLLKERAERYIAQQCEDCESALKSWFEENNHDYDAYCDNEDYEDDYDEEDDDLLF